MDESNHQALQHLLVSGDAHLNGVTVESHSRRPASPASSITLTGDRSDRYSALSATTGKPSSPAGDLDRTKTSRTSRGLWQWWPEVLAAVASIALFIALAAVLIYLDRTRQDRWKMPWQIKPNAVISVLITINGMTVAPILGEGISQLKWVFFEQRPQRLSEFQYFDEASRSPLGAAQFVYKLHWRATLASGGALLAVLALGMGPFTQQVLYTVDVQTNATNGLAEIGAASHYDSGSVQVQSNGAAAPLYNADGTAAASSSQDGVYQAGFVPATSPSAFPATFLSSSSGTLTQTSSPSVSVGASSTVTSTSILATFERRRRDESSSTGQSGQAACVESRMIRAAYGGLYNSNTQANFDCTSGNCTWPSFSTLGVCAECEDISNEVRANCLWHTGQTYDTCYYLLPAGDYFAEEELAQLEAKSNCESVDGTTSLYGTVWRSKLADFSSNNSALLTKFYSVQLPTDYVTMDSCQIPKATVRKCSISWCRKGFLKTSVTNGKLIDEPTEHTPLVAFDPSNTTCSGLRDLAGPSDNTTWKGLINANNSCPKTRADIADDDVFWVNTVDHDMTSSMFGSMFKDQELRPGDTSQTMNVAQVANLQAFIDNNDGDFTKTLGQLATGMTNYIRRNDGSRKITGVAKDMTTIYRVSWPWLIYPLVVLVCSLGFFIWTVFLSREKSKIVWKSSALAILAHGLDGLEDDELDSNSLKYMGEQAKELRAQLQQSEEGKLKLVRF